MAKRDPESDRERMVSLIERRGVTDEAVLAAMRAVPREEFVPERMRAEAFVDGPLPIGDGQTISQPYVVAEMTALLGLGAEDRVLEIGTGSGYQAAVLSLVAGEVYTVERIPSLCAGARDRLQRLGYGNVHVKCADGTLGWPEHSPYHGIIVTAGGPRVPASLEEQLAVGGTLVMPVGDRWMQDLVRVRRLGEDDWERERLVAVAFVPLLGEEGW